MLSVVDLEPSSFKRYMSIVTRYFSVEKNRDGGGGNETTRFLCGISTASMARALKKVHSQNTSIS